MIRSLLIALLLVTTPGAFAATPDRVVPAINELDTHQAIGQQPYEMTWTQREENPKTLVDFESLEGWKLELYDGATGEFRRSREQQMWGQHVGKFVYTGNTEKSRVIARPPAPIPIPERFDSIDLWGYGDQVRTGETRRGAPSYIAVLVEDANGREFRFQMTDVRWVSWWLIHHRALDKTLAGIAWPAKFSGIEILASRNETPRFFYCDSLAFYLEKLAPVSLKPQPRRNLKPYRGQITGINTGEGVLPFPTREETILPSNIEKAFKTAVRQVGPGRFEFRYEGKDAIVVYDYAPATGELNELNARVDKSSPFRPMDGGGIRFVDTPEGQVSRGTLVSAALSGDTVEARFRHGRREVDYHLRLWQKSLVLDAWCDGGEATELHFGRVSGVKEPKLITVPYISYSAGLDPRVLLSGGAAQPVFTSIWFDWYRTNASAPYYTKEPKVTADSATINGGMRYIPKTDGKRNNLYERIFVTASPVYEETLPTIANPSSLRQAEARPYVWTVTQPQTFEADHARCRRIRSYGLDKVMQHSHEVTWRDSGDSFTLRLKPAPQKGGEAKLKWYVKAQNALGWLQGVYSNYTDFAPVNTNWNPDFVQRTPEGEWRRGWYRCYALKPTKAVEFDDYYAPRIKEKYGVKMSYTDVHTSTPPPWTYTDFDARIPGAGAFASTFYAYGQLLRHDQSVYGPTQSEGTFQWMYAGLASGNYGWVYTDTNLLTAPLDPAFTLHKIHPLEANYGMGYTYYYLSRLDENWLKSPKRREYVDLFLATTIGYGNLGWLVVEWGLDEPFGVEAMTRSYYMMQQLQQQYAFVRPKTIEYATRDGKFISPGLAHATGAIADSRLHVVYENGTEVYVNRSATEPWTVAGTELPVNGWLAFNRAAGFREFSANVSGRRIDYALSPEFEFLDGRGAWTEQGGLGATGSVVRKQAEIIDLYGNDRISFRAKSVKVLTAFDPDGKRIGAVDFTSPQPGWYEFKTLKGARSYQVR